MQGLANTLGHRLNSHPCQVPIHWVQTHPASTLPFSINTFLSFFFSPFFFFNVMNGGRNSPVTNRLETAFWERKREKKNPLARKTLFDTAPEGLIEISKENLFIFLKSHQWKKKVEFLRSCHPLFYWPVMWMCTFTLAKSLPLYIPSLLELWNILSLVQWWGHCLHATSPHKQTNKLHKSEGYFMKPSPSSLPDALWVRVSPYV